MSTTNVFHKSLVKARTAVLVYLTHKMALPVLKLIRKPERFPYSLEQLRGFPENSLGRDLEQFLESRSLDLLPHYARHDIKHILLDYDTKDEGEVCLQCFMLGNGHISFPVAATVIYGFLTMPEHWSKFRKAFKRGRACVEIGDWPWFEILDLPTEILKERLKEKSVI